MHPRTLNFFIALPQKSFKNKVNHKQYRCDSAYIKKPITGKIHACPDFINGFPEFFLTMHRSEYAEEKQGEYDKHNCDKNFCCHNHLITHSACGLLPP